jgi:DNA-binding MarR family transcriptional regulator
MAMVAASEPDELPPYAVGQLLRRAHTRAARAFGEALAPLGIEGRHFGVLAVLADHGPRTQRDLVERVGSDRVSMMRIVDDLETRELAVRRPVPGDRRLRAVELTDQGREVFHSAESVARETSQALLAHLDTSERTALTGLLARFLQAEDG